MSKPLAINGLGRIGRALLRIVSRERESLALVAVNDIAPVEQLVPLIARDSLHGPYTGSVARAGDHLLLDGSRVQVFQRERPQRIPWDQTEAEIVVEATGRFLSPEAVDGHRKGRVDKVLLSANAARTDLTVCMGVNHHVYDPKEHFFLSAGSCTTNCLAPVAKVLDDAFGLDSGLLNTVHSYNNDQSLLDLPHKDPRRARAAGLNMIPTTTSAIRAVEAVLPQLEGKIDGLAVRVPAPNVSLIDFVVRLSKRPSLGSLAEAFRTAADGPLRGILAASEEELVSMDYLGDPHSAIVDLPLLQQVPGGLYRVVAWYDNEWGHASRLADLAELIAEGAG